MSPTSRSQNRTASIKARLKYETEQAFIEKYASNITKTGLFVKTSNPRPVGTRVKFEFQIADGTPVMRGLGEVEWDRKEASEDQPPGMGIKFLKVDAKTRSIVEQVVEFNRQNREPLERPSILPDVSHPEVGELVSAMKSAPKPKSDADKQKKKLEIGPAEKPPWESDPIKPQSSSEKRAAKKIDKTEISTRTKARRAAARRRRREGKGASTKEVNLESVDNLLEEIKAAPKPIVRKRTRGRKRHSDLDIKKAAPQEESPYEEPSSEETPLEETSFEEPSYEEAPSEETSLEETPSDTDLDLDGSTSDAEDLDDSSFQELEPEEVEAEEIEAEEIEAEEIEAEEIEAEEIDAEEVSFEEVDAQEVDDLDGDVEEVSVADVEIMEMSREETEAVPEEAESDSVDPDIAALGIDSETEEVPGLDLNTDAEISLESDLDDILNESDDSDDLALSEYDQEDELDDSPEDDPEYISRQHEPLLETEDVDDALDRLFVNTDVDAKSESEISREELPETLPDEAVPQGLVRESRAPSEPLSQESNVDEIYGSPSEAPAASDVPVPESEPEEAEEKPKKQGFFKRLFSKAPPKPS